MDELSPGQPVTTAPPVARASLPMDQAVAGFKDRLTARCRPASAVKMAEVVGRFAASAGWARVSDISLATAEATLGAKRRAEGAGKWSPLTHDHAVRVLRRFGDYLRRSGVAESNPLSDLEGIGAKPEDPARPMSEIEARALIAESWRRYRWSGQMTRCAPLFWLTMFYTGLRYSEAHGLTWGQIVIDPDGATLITDPNAVGNKSGDRDELPLRADMVALLDRWKSIVPHGESDPVFPCPPSHKTWQADRENAGIVRGDLRRGVCTPHSARKSFVTWLDAQAIPRGLVSHLARHAGTLAEQSYIQHDQGVARLAVEALPRLWPDDGDFFAPIRRKTVDKAGNVRHDGTATLSVPPTMCIATSQLDQVTGPEGMGLNVAVQHHGQGLVTQPSCDIPESRPMSETDSARGSSGNPCFLNSLDSTETRVADALARWLSSRTGRGSQEP